MKRFPEDVEEGLVRALGAFVRATSARDLPGSLRRFQGFTPSGLMRQRAGLLATLDSDGVRGRVGEWLDLEPSIARGDLELLRLAVERPDGWEDKLEARAGPARPERQKRGVPDADERIERERAKARRARETLTELRETARKEIAEERAKVRARDQEIQSLSARLRAEERDRKRAEQKHATTVAGLERDARRARRGEEKATGLVEELRRDLSVVRRTASASERRVAELESKAARASRPTSSKTAPPSEPESRSPLPVPQGLLEDAPETLDAWLNHGRAHLLVDGYNVSKHEAGYGDLSLEAQRGRLVDEVTRLVRAKKVDATIVFDGANMPPGTSRRARGPVKVEYSKPPESGDDHLVGRLGTLPNFPVIVVTDDRELRERASALGATLAFSTQLLALIRP